MGAAFQRVAERGPEGSSPTGDEGMGWFAKLRCEHGSAAVETSLSVIVVMTLVLGLMECCMISYNYSVLSEACREGVRYASLHGTDSSSCSGPSMGCADSTGANVVTDVTNYAKSFTGNLSSMKVVVTYPDGTSTATSRVQVAITETYQPIFHYPGMTHVLSASSAGRILY